MKISDRIQSLRKTKGLSQEELADKIGVSRQAVSKWENDQSIPDLDKIVIMSDYFYVTTDYILRGLENDSISTDNIPNAISDNHCQHQKLLDSKKIHKVTIFRESQMYLVNPPINISINGKMSLSIENGQTIVLDLDDGYYIFEFSLHVRKRHVDINLENDTLITLSWNRVTGSLRAMVS